MKIMPRGHMWAGSNRNWPQINMKRSVESTMARNYSQDFTSFTLKRQDFSIGQQLHHLDLIPITIFGFGRGVFVAACCITCILSSND